MPQLPWTLNQSSGRYSSTSLTFSFLYVFDGLEDAIKTRRLPFRLMSYHEFFVQRPFFAVYRKQIDTVRKHVHGNVYDVRIVVGLGEQGLPNDVADRHLALIQRKCERKMNHFRGGVRVQRRSNIPIVNARSRGRPCDLESVGVEIIVSNECDSYPVAAINERFWKRVAGIACDQGVRIRTGVVEVQMIFGADIHLLKSEGDDRMGGETEIPGAALVVSIVVVIVTSVINDAVG